MNDYYYDLYNAMIVQKYTLKQAIESGFSFTLSEYSRIVWKRKAVAK